MNATSTRALPLVRTWGGKCQGQPGVTLPKI
jgi:hypothetical protein